MTTSRPVQWRPRPGEWWPVLGSAALFFCILAAYYVLRPVRDEMAVRAGTASLKWLFTATFVSMLIATPAFGWVAARVRRGMLVPGSIAFFASHLVLFRSLLDQGAAAAFVFFVWVSVFNLFVVSLFWSLMADRFSLEQAQRLYGPIAIGGSLGAIAGPAATATLADAVGVPNLLLLSMALLTVAAVLAVALTRAPAASPTENAASADESERGPGGSAWAGLRLTLRSRTLRRYCGYLWLHSLVGTVLYFEQTRIAREAFAAPEARTAFFAQVDLAVNLLTVVTQLLGLAPLVQRFGLPVALALLPAISLVGLGAFGIAPTLAVLVAFGIVRRAGEYAIARPAREMIFTVLPRSMKYQAKNFLDTAVFRGADALGSWCVDAARAVGMAGSSLALAALPVAAAGVWIGWHLGKLPNDSRDTGEPDADPPPSPPPLDDPHGRIHARNARR